MIGGRNWAESLTSKPPVSLRTMLLSHDMGLEDVRKFQKLVTNYAIISHFI